MGKIARRRGRYIVNRAAYLGRDLDLLASLDPSLTVDRESRVVDDGVISSAGVSAGMDLAFHVVVKVCGEAVAVETARYNDYPWTARTAVSRT